MEENMKIHDFSTNLGRNPLLTLLLHVSLSRIALSLSLKIKKISKTMNRISEKWEKSYLYGWICHVRLKGTTFAWSKWPWNPTLATRWLPHSLILLNSLKRAGSEQTLCSLELSCLSELGSLQASWLCILVDFLVLACIFLHKKDRVSHIKHKWHICIKLELFYR